MIFIRKKIFLILLVLVSITGLAWFTYQRSIPKLDDHTIAIVGNTPIKVSDFEKQLNNTKTNYSPEYTDSHLSSLKKSVLKKMIIDSLLLQEAKKKNIEVSKEELERYVKNITYGYSRQELGQLLFSQFKSYDEWVLEIKQKLLIEKVISKIMLENVNVPEESIKTYYKENYEGKTSPPKVKLAQIFTSSKEKAQKALDEVNAGIDFMEVAKKYSESPESKNGGLLGNISKGQGIELFDKAFDMQDQAVSGILQSEFGFHILKVLSHIPATQVSYEQARPIIVSELAGNKEAKVYEQWLSSKMKKTTITQNKALLDSVK